MTTEIATHESPVWRDEANFLIFADLSRDGMAGRWEQVWAHQLSDTEFRLCCIPFFAYGLALGDRVVTESRDGKKYVIQSAIEKSGRTTFRVWFGNARDFEGARFSVEQYVRSQGWLFEWSSRKLLAIDIPSLKDVTDFKAFIEKSEERDGITFESGA